MNSINTQVMTAAKPAPQSAHHPRKSWTGRWRVCAAICLIATGLPACAATREVTIAAPDTAVSGSAVTVAVSASTNIGSNEQIGFIHSDYSVDGGVTWTAISYATNAGTKSTRTATFTAGAAGSKVMIRMKVAFRGGLAGDVDYTGKPIAWDGSWAKWQEPPAKNATIAIVAK